MNGKIRALAVAALGFVLSAPMAARAQDATGAGSSFPNSVIQKWVAAAQTQIGVNVKFDPIGSGGGRSKILAGDVDFGVSEMPMPDDMKATGNLTQFPISVGGVVCVANVPGLKHNQLKLNGVLLGNIYTGKIKMWNDLAIAAINPGVKLPDMEIKPVFQKDMIGTTFVFTQYILAANADWREKFGPQITKRWAIGSAVDGNIYMGEVIATVPGSIGYMDFNTAVTKGYPTVSLLNRAGKYVAPNPANFAVAAANADWKKAPDLVVSLIDQPGDNAWPIVTPSYVQIPLHPADKARRQTVLKFFDFAYRKGGAMATESNLVPLPAAVQDTVRALWAKSGS